MTFTSHIHRRKCTRYPALTRSVLFSKILFWVSFLLGPRNPFLPVPRRHFVVPFRRDSTPTRPSVSGPCGRPQFRPPYVFPDSLSRSLVVLRRRWCGGREMTSTVVRLFPYVRVTVARRYTVDPTCTINVGPGVGPTRVYRPAQEGPTKSQSLMLNK